MAIPENRIQYDEACPDCSNGGIINKLFLDMDKVEIRCDIGHVFEELPSDTALRSVQPAVASSAVVEQVSGSAGTGNDPAAVPAEIEETNTLQEEASAKLAEISDAIESQQSGAIPEAVAVPEAPQVVVDGRRTFVMEDGAISCANGDLIIALRIPEAWRQAVEAEAEAQLKSPAAYVASWVTSEEMKTTVIDWLQNYWSASYSQTV